MCVQCRWLQYKLVYALSSNFPHKVLLFQMEARSFINLNFYYGGNFNFNWLVKLITGYSFSCWFSLRPFAQKLRSWAIKVMTADFLCDASAVIYVGESGPIPIQVNGKLLHHLHSLCVGILLLIVYSFV